MTERQQELFHSRLSSGNFLLSKTDALTPEEQTETQQSQVTESIKAVFPEILSGKSFIERAVTGLTDIKKFGVIVIRLDHYEPPANSNISENDFLMVTAQAIDIFCKECSGIWGQLSHDILGCYFPDKNDNDCLMAVDRIRQDISDKTAGSISAGAAAFPAINYNKTQIVDNAIKALNHAAFFGEDSAVAFDSVSLNISGDTFYQHGDLDGAIEEFKLALRLDPSNVNVHNSLGVCYGDMGQFEKALEEFESTIWLDKTEVMATFNAGLANMLLGNREKALEYFLKAGNLDDDTFEVAFQLGRFFLEDNKHNQALPYLEKASAMNDVPGTAYRYLGDCYAALERDDDAVAVYEKAVKTNPNDAFSLSALGYLYDKLGKNSEIAKTFCEQSVEISPDNALFRQRLGIILLSQGLLVEALEALKKADEMGCDCSNLIDQAERQFTARAS
ncbi:MAG: tetratricopeptide repeat protein [Desulfobacterales bacterium]|nr:tetratricopeptide repeat protein [Desulfobacterales bacterium]